MERCIAHQTTGNKSRTSILTQPTKFPIKQQSSRDIVVQEAERMYKPEDGEEYFQILFSRNYFDVALRNSQQLYLPAEDKAGKNM